MAPNHSSGGFQTNIAKRFMEQVSGSAKPEYSAGRMGDDDEGDLAYAITTDDKAGVIVIRFGKPVEWFGMGVKEATELRDALNERIANLRGITP